MPARLEQMGESGISVRQIVASTSDADFLDHLIESMRDHSSPELWHALDKLSKDRDADIEHMCTNNHQEFVKSVSKLDKGREDSMRLGGEILSLVRSYQESTDNLAAQKKTLVDSRSVRQNIDDSAEALKECLELLRLSNTVYEHVGKQKHYSALRSLDDLQNLLRLQESSRYKIGDMIENSIPATQKMIAEAVMTDLNTWLYYIRDVSQYIGEVAFFRTEQRRTRQRERAEKDQFVGSFKLNSPIELVADETEEYDVLNDEDANTSVDWDPLFECLHIHEALGRSERFRAEYAATRRSQKDLIIPSVLRLDDEEASQLKTLLEGITGFSIIERATLKRTENMRTSADVDELWESMCQSAVNLMSTAVYPINDAEMILRVTGVVSLFIQTMESYQFTNTSLNTFLLSLFARYTNLLKDRCIEDFHEIVSTDDYMPMPINNVEEYDKIIDVGWYMPDKERDEITFPCVLPFSQMYPMCCIDIRNFLNQVYSAPDDYLQRSSAVDETIRSALDDLLCERVCRPLIDHLSSQFQGQIVQILTNLEHFERACQQLQFELAATKGPRGKTSPVTLKATQKFREGRRKAKDRIFSLVNSKIDDLMETAEYDWSSTTVANEPSAYMTELTRYLSNIMNSVLLGLPVEIKDQIYVDALDHAASSILALPLDPSIKMITPSSVHRLELDVSHLTDFVTSIPSSLPPSANSSDPNTPATTTSQSDKQPQQKQQSTTPPTLSHAVSVLSQTIALMASTNPDEFYDITQRNSKYGAVNPQDGPLLLEKVEMGRRMTTSQMNAGNTAGFGGNGNSAGNAGGHAHGLGYGHGLGMGAGAGFGAGAGTTSAGLGATGGELKTKASASDRFGGMMRGLRTRAEGQGSGGAGAGAGAGAGSGAGNGGA